MTTSQPTAPAAEAPAARPTFTRAQFDDALQGWLDAVAKANAAGMVSGGWSTELAATMAAWDVVQQRRAELDALVGLPVEE